jgi:hypothetical protein
VPKKYFLPNQKLFKKKYKNIIFGGYIFVFHNANLVLNSNMYGGGLIFALRALRLRSHSYEHYEHLTSMLKPYEGRVSESSIAGFLYLLPQPLVRCACEGLSCRLSAHKKLVKKQSNKSVLFSLL